MIDEPPRLREQKKAPTAKFKVDGGKIGGGGEEQPVHDDRSPI
jgi:hypothetical protein